MALGILNLAVGWPNDRPVTSTLPVDTVEPGRGRELDCYNLEEFVLVQYFIG